VSSAPRALRVSIRTAVWMAEKSISQVRWGHFVKRVHTHVQATSDTGTFQWLLVGVLLTGGHETRHPAIVSNWECMSYQQDHSLMLGQLDLATTEGREGDVGDLHLACWGRHCEYGIRE